MTAPESGCVPAMKPMAMAASLAQSGGLAAAKGGPMKLIQSCPCNPDGRPPLAARRAIDDKLFCAVMCCCNAGASKGAADQRLMQQCVNDVSPSHQDDEPVFAAGLSQFYGQPMFAVIAETREAARRASKLVRVIYEDLPAALAPYGVVPDRIPVAFNCFMNVPVDGRTGKLKVLPPLSKAGDHIAFRAEIDLIIGLTACSAPDSNGGSFKPIHYRIDG